MFFVSDFFMTCQKDANIWESTPPKIKPSFNTNLSSTWLQIQGKEVQNRGKE
jgi:hypothetical protein